MRPHIKTALFTVLYIICIHKLKAQDTPSDTAIYRLNEVTISDVYEAQKNDPISYQNLKATDINSINTGQEPSFILSNTPSITLYSDAGSYQGYSYFRLRGIDQTRVNMTLDGVPLNEPEDQGAYFSNYPDFLNSVSSIQIQRGIGTSKNGTASYAGSINFTSPRLFTDSTSTSIGLGYGSFNTYRIYAEHQQQMANKSLYLRASSLHSDGYKYRSGNDSKSIFYGAGIYHKKHKFKLIGFMGNQKNEMAWLGVSEEAIRDDPRSNAHTDEDDNFSQVHTQVQHQYFLNEHSTINSSIYYNHLQGDYDFDLNNFLGLPSTDTMYNYAVKSNFIGALSNISYSSEKVNLYGGIHINHYERNHIGSERNIGTLYENTGTKNEFSLFSKLFWSIIQPIKIFIDLQYRHASFDYSGSVMMDKLDWNFFNPTGGITYMPNSKLEIYYSLGRAGREPTRTDLFGGSDDLLANDKNQPILFITDPEYVIDQELGFRIKGDKSFLAFNIYRMNFDNEIVLNGQFGPNGLALNDKVKKSFRQGVETHFTTEILDPLKLTSNLSLNKSEIQEQGEAFSPILTPSVIFNQEVAYIRDRVEIGLQFRYQGSSFIDFSNENSLDDYTLLNLRASYQFKHLKFTGFINNLFDKTYFNNGYVDYDNSIKLFVQAPRNYYCMISYTF